LPQDNSKFFDGNELDLVNWLRQFSKDQSEIYIRSWLGRMLFSGEEALKKVKVLSGGEKVRCMFAKMMLEGANVLLFDEPTNHLDLESITSLNKGMQAFRGPLLFTSHDQELVETVANRIIDIKSPTNIVDKSMSYEEFVKAGF
jgi:ATPase subunit of ABC transporter with duplicated ATPase domains